MMPVAYALPVVCPGGRAIEQAIKSEPDAVTNAPVSRDFSRWNRTTFSQEAATIDGACHARGDHCANRDACYQPICGDHCAFMPKMLSVVRKIKSTAPPKFLSGDPLLGDLCLVSESERAPIVETSGLFRMYLSVLPRWLRRFRVPAADAPDVLQEVWLAVCDGSLVLPKDTQQARLALFKVTRRIAQNLRRREARDAQRHVPEPDDFPENLDVDEYAAHALALFEAIDQLPPPHHELARDYVVLGYTIKEMAERAGGKENTMERRVWRARLELTKILQMDPRKRYSDQKKKEGRRGLLVAPLALQLDAETRATFCAIWEAEGRLPAFGGPTDPPPPPVDPPVIATLPGGMVVSTTIGTVVAVFVAIVVLILVPVGIVALDYFWNPTNPSMARAGLHVPPMPNIREIEAMEDVVPAYSASAQPPPAPIAPTTAAPKSRVSKKPLTEEARKALQFDGSVFNRSGND